MIRLCLTLILVCTSAQAEAVFAARTIRARTIIEAGDLVVRDVALPGGVTNPSLLIGQEAKVTLYVGRPVSQNDVGFPAIVERNQIIPLIYNGAGLFISAEGRALDRAGPGDSIRVMNLASRTTIFAIIGADGAGYVSN